MKSKIKRKVKINNTVFIVLLLIVILLFISTSYSLWSTDLQINGTITTNYSGKKLPVELEPLGNDKNGVNRYTSNTTLEVIGVEIYKVVDEKYENNTITTTIKQTYKQIFSIFNVKPEITLTIPNNTSDMFVDGKIELIEYNDSNNIFQNRTHTVSETIVEGATGTVSISGQLRGDKDVATNTYYKYKITYNVNGIENIFYYNINLLPMD